MPAGKDLDSWNIFYAQSFAIRLGVDRMVGDCIHTMKQMNVKIAFLPLCVQGDLVKILNFVPPL
ncbi:MAG: hypothetical protein ABIN89_24830 [Chitinophagaceae bacterium]